MGSNKDPGQQCWTMLSHLAVSHSLHVTPWTVANQAPQFMGIVQARYWSRLSCPPPGDFPNLGIELRSPTLHFIKNFKKDANKKYNNVNK